MLEAMLPWREEGTPLPMSFTQDELQALNTLFDQKMLVLRRELERSLDQRMQGLRREFEQRQTSILQDLLRNFSRRVAEQQHKSRDSLNQRLDFLHTRTAQTIERDIEQQQEQGKQQLEDMVERGLAAQLLAFEQLMNQRTPTASAELPMSYAGEMQPDFDTIEVQTEIPWEDLVELVDNALAQRLSTLSTTFHIKLKEMERALSAQLYLLREELQHKQPQAQPTQSATRVAPPVAQLTSMQDVFGSIEQLERLIESMQVAMTANSALLTNRLYHHQRLPLERAHPTQHDTPPVEPTVPRENAPLLFSRKREE